MKRGATAVFGSNAPYANGHDHCAMRNKRTKLFNGGRVTSNIIDFSDPSTLQNVLDNINSSKYGSMEKEIKDLVNRCMQSRNSMIQLHPDIECTSAVTRHNLSGEAELGSKEVVDLDSIQAMPNVPAAGPVVIIDSDDDDGEDRKPFHHFQSIAFPTLPIGLLPDNLLVDNGARVDASKEENKRIHKDRGVYLGVEDDIQEEDHECTAEDDGLSDIWKQMNIALEYSKDVPADQSSDHSTDDDEGCDHSFVLKDDLGYVCRVCGVIQRSIETIFDFQYIKTARTRSYRSDSRSNRENDGGGVNLDKLSGHDLTVTEICPHPRHQKQMKPHQLEGFNFLLSNLITENPGGCILAHAPGSGKTFMIISFMQSFLAQYPDARPLVILPKGILPTWKKEFQRWQVEDIPLLDFYSMKADNRVQQMEVLKQWVDKRSILFLGYKQFSSIVTGNSTCKITANCQEILLQCPTILILDEGHTPRNENTDVLHSLSKVQTPRKVVLSGTLYQNHVKEVFNILNLVRPKFLKLETSRILTKRIMSRVQFSGCRKQLKGQGESGFFELVEHTLQQDDDSKRKEAVIKDLREMTSKVLHYYKGDFLDDLPGLVDFTVLLRLTPKQKSSVQHLKKSEKTKFKRSSVGSAVYTHPMLKQFSDAHSGGEKNALPSDDKIDELIDKIDVREGVKAKFFLNLLALCERAGEKLLVFSQYLLPLKFLERLSVQINGWSVGREVFMISGDSSTEQREVSMDRFNNSSNARVFFGSIKACGEGISLVGASRIMILDVHLNPSVSRQAIGRAFRPGQERKVYTYRLVAAESLEEEDHLTCFKKELIAKRWFEWDQYSGNLNFEMEMIDPKDSGDIFIESRTLSEDVKALYRR